MRAKWTLIVCALFVVSLVFGCAGLEAPGKAPYKMSSQGTVIWEDEFEFVPPPPDWKLLRVEGTGGDINFGFMKVDPGSYPSLTTFAYDEEPFGCATKFEDREREFFKRFLFNAILQFRVIEKKKTQVFGKEGLEVSVEGKDPVKKEKVRAKVLFGKRGDRIVAFYITQWRPMDGAYDASVYDVFEKFVNSFKFLKKSFYETL